MKRLMVDRCRVYYNDIRQVKGGEDTAVCLMGTFLSAPQGLLSKHTHKQNTSQMLAHKACIRLNVYGYHHKNFIQALETVHSKEPKDLTAPLLMESQK